MKVTKEQRELLVNRVVRETLKDRWEAYEAKRMEFGNNVYTALYTIEEHSVLKRLPGGFFCEKNSVRFASPGAGYDEMKEPFPFGGSRRFACKHHWDSSYGKDDFSPEDLEVLVAEWRTIRLAKVNLDAEEAGLQEKLRVFLAPLTTYAKLFAAWPEAANYISVPETQKNLPTVLVDEVRETIARAKGGGA